MSCPHKWWKHPGSVVPVDTRGWGLWLRLPETSASKLNQPPANKTLCKPSTLPSPPLLSHCLHARTHTNTRANLVCSELLFTASTQSRSWIKWNISGFLPIVWTNVQGSSTSVQSILAGSWNWSFWLEAMNRGLNWPFSIYLKFFLVVVLFVFCFCILFACVFVCFALGGWIIKIIQPPNAICHCLSPAIKYRIKYQ